MSGLEAHQGVLHTIKAWLYPNYLRNVEGKYVARAKAETPLSIENICASATTRGGVELNYEAMVEAVKLYYGEAMYQLADGFSVDNGYYSIRPAIKGAFEHAESPIDLEKNRIDFTFQKRKGMRELLKYITVKLQGIAQTEAYIGEIEDVSTQSVDDALSPGGVLIITGYKIKIDGPDADNGVYFIDASSGARTKVTSHFVENLPSRLVIQIPALGAGIYHLEISTQFSGNAKYIKAPRIVNYGADLTVSA
jgi:hypothetical protein